VINREVYTRTLSGDLGTAEIIYCPEISVPERPQTGQVRITKLDAETAGRAQGDATLAGAVFDLLDADGKLVERLYCGNSNSITSKEVKLGSYTVKEVSPPRGYTLTQKSYPIKIDYVGQEVSINLVSENVSNVVIKGKIQLVKHSDDPDPDVSPDNDQVQEPLKDIVFEVYLKSSGSYNKARPTERDLITTDEHGYARTKDLPYGTYTVKEVEGADEHKIADPFDVFISQNGRTYYYIVENPAYHGKVKIIKTDAETGRAIPQPGIEFKIKDVDTGEWVAQEILYPTPVIIDSYLTNADGWLVMPKPLRFGNYELYEVQAPYGYTLSETPIPFKVTSENPVEFLEVKMPNAPVKGTVTVRKTGEVLTGAAKVPSGGRKVTVPEYTVRGIEGATFDIIAAEDIVTPDGTIRAEKGEIVDTITTEGDGYVTSKELYLGDYYAVETAVPYSFILDETPLPFSLVYEDQHTAFVSAETGLYNERAKGEIALIKTGEKASGAEDGSISYTQTPVGGIVFGLYAREDIMNVDGEVVIKAGSLMDILVTGVGGKAASTRDIPFGSYYVKELQTHGNLVMNRKEYDAIFEYGGDKAPLTTITVNEGKPIRNYLIKGRIKLIKTGEDNEPLEGVTFSVTGAVTGVTVKLTTDENGEAVTGLLPYDRYTIVETGTREGYVLDENQYTILVSRNGETYEFGLMNEMIRGRIKIIKVDAKTGEPLEGVVFELTDAEGSVTCELTTGADGTALSDELVYGAYTVTEKSTGDAYLLDETSHEVFIKNHEQTIELEIANVKKQGKVKIIKTDSKTGAPLEGVVFEVKDAEGNIVSELTTDKDGTAITDWLDYGAYTVTEKSTGEAYLLDETSHEVFIRDHEQTIELEIANVKKQGKVKIIKTDKVSGMPLAGVVFEVLDADGAVIAILTTDKNGTAITDWLDYGDYTVKEKTAAPGYILDETLYETQIREHEKVYEMELTNDKIPVTPKTGDDSKMGLWLAIAGASAAILAGLGVYATRGKIRKGEHHGA
jgi:uncharacterized surface anchored protein